MVSERSLDVHHVGHRHGWEAAAPGEAIRTGARRTCCALASAQDVRAHDKPAIRIDRHTRTDQSQPPSSRSVSRSHRAGDVRVTGQGMADVDRIVTIRRQSSPRLIRHRDVRQNDRGLGGELPDRQESTITRVVPLPPGCARGRGALIVDGICRCRQGQPCLADRKPASRSARMSSSASNPTARRTRPGVTPAASCCSGVSWECVVDAG